MPVNSSLGDLVASTARQFANEGDLFDHVTNDNGLLRHLKQKGRFEKYTGGGRTIVESFIYGNNSSTQWYDGYDTFTPNTALEVLDGAEFSWKQLGAFATISGKERRLNRGEEQHESLIKVRIKQMVAQLKNTLADAIYSDGTGSGGKELGGLRLLVADNPAAAGTVGGIDQAANSFWRNKFSAAAATSASNVISRQNALHLAIRRGSDKPTLWVNDDDWFSYYEAALQPLQQIGNAKSADAGYAEYMYKGAPFIYDAQCPDKRQYALNLDDLNVRVIDDRSDMFEVGNARQVINGDYEVVPVFFMGALTTGRRASHGVNIAS